VESRTRRRHHRDELRQTILDAAVELIETHGGGFTIRLLADRIGYSPRTVYLYYENKDTLLDAVVDRVFTQTLESLDSAESAGTSLEALLSSQIERHMRNALNRPRLYRAVVERLASGSYEPVPADERLRERTAILLAGGVGDRLAGHPRDVAEVFLAALRGATTRLIGRSTGLPNDDADRTIHIFTRMTLRGLL